ncbi:GNAT family N-acetyltransferase [Saccharopolyspora hordei]|uniref:Ribosomal protein S18 acetylase RimI-like enzyme n=1 Tax=Saccharopolyspora hordei TaxID=1838 RepID=A0A853AU28_9PSEU|nr:ribosomal protein S18 acetylase RimI-like enzyme [Saccharopolyspora hordei]
MTIEVARAADLGESYRRPITEVFVDGFGPDFSFFSNDPRTLTDALAHALVLDVFHVALVDGEPGVIAACTDGRQRSLRCDPAELRRHLGPVKGTVAGAVFRRTFTEALPHPVEGTASLEFVASATRFRGQGVAKALLQHLLALPQYREYLLVEVAGTNEPALRLYEKLGFREYARTKVRHTRWTGIHHYVSLRLVQS